MESWDLVRAGGREDWERSSFKYVEAMQCDLRGDHLRQFYYDRQQIRKDPKCRIPEPTPKVRSRDAKSGVLDHVTGVPKQIILLRRGCGVQPAHREDQV